MKKMKTTRTMMTDGNLQPDTGREPRDVLPALQHEVVPPCGDGRRKNPVGLWILCPLGGL